MSCFRREPDPGNDSGGPGSVRGILYCRDPGLHSQTPVLHAWPPLVFSDCPLPHGPFSLPESE
eukprot:15430168-Alexandrium_andersonii.AAC.1